MANSRSVVVKQLIRCCGLIQRDGLQRFHPWLLPVYADIKLCFVVMAVVRIVAFGGVCYCRLGLSFEINEHISLPQTVVVVIRKNQ